VFDFYDVFGRLAENIEEGILDGNSLDSFIWNLLEQEEFQEKLKKLLIAFGQGVFGDKGKPSTSVEEKVLYAFGRHVNQRVKDLRKNRILMSEQKKHIKSVSNVRKLNHLKNMSPEEFEYWTASYFERFGFRSVTVTTYSSDFGVDVDMKCPDGRRAIVQCKRYKGVVGRPTVQQTFGVMKLLKAKRCYVVTTGRFTSAALDVGRRRDIILLDGDRISSNRPPAGSRPILR